MYLQLIMKTTADGTTMVFQSGGKHRINGVTQKAAHLLNFYQHYEEI